MGNDAFSRTPKGAAFRVEERLADLETRLGPTPSGGSVLARNFHYPLPTTDAQRVALANRRVRWFNTDTGFEQIYYAVAGTTGLLVPGLFSGLTAGWYSAPHAEWATLGGPSGHSGAPGGAYACTWSKGVRSADATLNPFNTFGGSIHGITIGIDGQYEVSARQRAASVNAYIALGLNGDRAAIENRVDGMFDHDHAGIVDGFTTSHYIGKLLRGEIVTMGPPPGQGATVRYGASTFNGTLTIRRIS